MEKELHGKAIFYPKDFLPFPKETKHPWSHFPVITEFAVAAIMLLPKSQRYRTEAEAASAEGSAVLPSVLTKAGVSSERASSLCTFLSLLRKKGDKPGVSVSNEGIANVVST